MADIKIKTSAYNAAGNYRDVEVNYEGGLGPILRDVIENRRRSCVELSLSRDELRDIVFALMHYRDALYKDAVKYYDGGSKDDGDFAHKNEEDLAWLFTEAGRLSRLLFDLRENHTTEKRDFVTKYLDI